MKRKEEIVLFRNGLMAVLFVGTLTYFGIKYAPVLIELFTSTEKLREIVLSYGDSGILVFMGFQIMHILIPVLPGEFVQIAGGYIFGAVRGTIILMTATFIGTTAVFYIARWIGYPLVKILVKPQTLCRMERIVNSPKGELVFLILMLIPGFPKDTLVYVAGVSPMAAWRFILISMVGRFPVIAGSAYIGANLQRHNYRMVFIMAVITLAATGAGIYFRKHPLFHFPHHEHDHEGLHPDHDHAEHQLGPGNPPADLPEKPDQ